MWAAFLADYMFLDGFFAVAISTERRYAVIVFIRESASATRTSGYSGMRPLAMAGNFSRKIAVSAKSGPAVVVDILKTPPAHGTSRCT